MPKKGAASATTVQQAAERVATSDQPDAWADTPDTPYAGSADPGTDGDTNTVAQADAVNRAAAQEEAQETAADAAKRAAPRSDLGFIGLDDTTTYINALWYGREGTSKTSSIATIANLGPLLLINAEAGVKLHPLRALGVNTANVMVWPRPGVKITFDAMEDLFWKMKSDLDENPDSWAGIGFDSLTEIVQLLLEDIAAGEREKAIRAGKERDRFMIARDDYRTMSGQVRLLIRRFRDLNCHFVATCLERKDIDEDTGKVMYGPAITPALQSDVLGFMDLVLYCKSEEIGDTEEFRAATRAGARHRAKDRFGATPRVMITPTFARVHDYVTGKLTHDTDEEAQRSEKLHREWSERAAAEQAKTAEKTTTTRRRSAAAKKEEANA